MSRQICCHGSAPLPGCGCANPNAGRSVETALGTFLPRIPSKHQMARVVDFVPPGMTVSCEMTPRILIADDQPDLLDALKLLLKGQGIEYDAVTSPEAAVRALESRPF